MIKHEGNCTGNDDPFCLCPDEQQPVSVGDVLTDGRGEWRVLSTDRSGQGLVLVGPTGQVSCEPVNEDGTLMFPQNWR